MMNLIFSFIKNFFHGKVCSANEVSCSNGDCISDQLVCNQVQDCPDGSDEKDDICCTFQLHYVKNHKT